MNESILLVTCSDSLGIIAHVSNVLSQNGYNILSLWEHADREGKKFFMRVRVDKNMNPDLFSQIKSGLPQDAKIWLKGPHRKKLLVLATKEPHCLGDILLQASYGDLDADIAGVISNHENLREITESFKLPFYFVPHQQKTQAQHEAKIEDIIKKCRPDLMVLAKYMRILSKDFIDRYPGKIINIHHSFLPAFMGAKPYHQAYARGVKLIGATAHFVTEDLDDGPIISQAVNEVNHSQSATELKLAGRIIEQNTLTKALRLVLDERVFINGNRTIVFE